MKKYKKHLVKEHFSEAGKFRSWCNKLFTLKETEGREVDGFCKSCKRAYYAWRNYESERNRKLREKGRRSHDRV